MSKLHDILNYPVVYLAVQRLLGAYGARQTCLREYARPQAGERILDVGCGPGYILDYLPECDFVGIDIDQRYIRYAQRRYPRRGQFLCMELTEDSASQFLPFDLILCNGLIHHLTDEQTRNLLSLLRRLLRPSGRLMTLDGCYYPQMSAMSRFLLKHDRGKYVRTEEEYLRLVHPQFNQIDAFRRSDLFSIPYDALVMVCRN